MKAFLSFSTLLIFCLTLYGQQIRRPHYFNMSYSYYNAGKFIFKGNKVLDSINCYTATDSMLWNKLIFENDTKGNRTSVAYYSYNAHNPEAMDCIGALLTKYEYKYDGLGNLLSCREKLPDEPYLVNTAYQYNNFGQLITEIATRTFDSIKWDDFGKTELIYNREGWLQNEIHVYGKDSSRSTYLYDTASSNLLKFSREYQNNGQWIEDRRIEYNYGSNYKISTLKSYHTSGNPSIFLGYEASYLYDDTSLIELDERSYEFNGTVWYATKTFFIYASGEKKVVVKKLVNDVWENMSQSIYQYNESDEEISFEEYSWDQNAWKGNRKIESQYTEGLKNCEIYYYENNQEWKPYEKRYFFYSGIKNGVVLSVAQKENPSIFCYTMKSKIYIRSNSNKNILSVYSLEGRNLLTRQIGMGTTMIEMDDLKGIFIVRLSNNLDNKVQKIVIE